MSDSTEAELLINKVKRISNLQCSLLKAQIDGMGISSVDFDEACGRIKESVDEMFYSKIIEAKEVIRQCGSADHHEYIQDNSTYF